MWFSNSKIPQEIIFNVSNIKTKPLIIRGFGIYCSNSSSYNPKIIEVLCQRKNKQKYSSLGNFKLSQSAGTQILTTEEIIFNDIERIKFIIKETYGGNKICLNKIYLYEYLPSSQFEISNVDMNLDDESYINKNSINNSNKMILGDLNINDTSDINKLKNNNNINNNNNENEKIISNNLPTRTTEILISESDLTDTPKKKKKKYFSLETKKDNLEKNTINNNNQKIKDNNKTDNKKNNKINKKRKSEQKIIKTNKEEEKNISYISEKVNDKIEDNNTIQTKRKDIYNNSNIIFTTTDVKNNSIENNNNNILNTISNTSNNDINNIYEKYIIFKNDIKNKVKDFDSRISYIENDINNLKDVINEILNNLNEIINNNNSNKDNNDNYYNCILTECKKYIDQKMSINLETMGNNNNYYYNTQPYNNSSNIYNKVNNKISHQYLNYNNSELFNFNNSNNYNKSDNVYINNSNTNINNNDNFRNEMNLSKIIKTNSKKPQLTQQFTKNKSHKNLFISLNRKQGFEQFNNLNNNKLSNKTNIKKEKYKRIKKEEQNKIEKILNNKLNKKLSIFNEEIEDKIYKSLLQPTLRELEKNLQNNIDSIKETLRSHSVNYSQNNIKNFKTTRAIGNNSNYSSYFNDIKKNMNFDNKNKTKRLYQISNNYLNNNNYKNSNEDVNCRQEEDNEDNNDNSVETENIKRNILKKQHQLNDLLYKLNNKQNESLNHYISFRKENKSLDIKHKY